jgi:hypothetical protein
MSSECCCINPQCQQFQSSERLFFSEKTHHKPRFISYDELREVELDWFTNEIFYPDMIFEVYQCRACMSRVCVVKASGRFGAVERIIGTDMK